MRWLDWSRGKRPGGDEPKAAEDAPASSSSEAVGQQMTPMLDTGGHMAVPSPIAIVFTDAACITVCAAKPSRQADFDRRRTMPLCSPHDTCCGSVADVYLRSDRRGVAQGLIDDAIALSEFQQRIALLWPQVSTDFET